MNDLRAFAKTLADLGKQVRSKPRFLTGKMVERIDDFHARVDLGPKLVTAYVSLILGPALAEDQMVSVRVQDSSYVITDILTGTLATLISVEDVGKLRQLTNGLINRWPTLLHDDGSMTMTQSDMKAKVGWYFEADDPNTEIRCELSRHEWDYECQNSSNVLQSMALWMGDTAGSFTLYGCGSGQAGVPIKNDTGDDQVRISFDIADPDHVGWQAAVGVDLYSLSGKFIRREEGDYFSTDRDVNEWHRIIDGVDQDFPEMPGLRTVNYWFRNQFRTEAFMRPYVRFTNTVSGPPIFFTNFEAYPMFSPN